MKKPLLLWLLSLNDFQEKLSTDEFSKLFGLLLTDRGVEFEIINLFLFTPNTKEVRLNIIPNNLDISNITQEDINLMFDHINSTLRESLNGKTPYEMFEFLMVLYYLE